MSQSKRKKVEKVIRQVKEPMSLLHTLKEEGMSKAMQFASIAGTAAKNINFDGAKDQLKATVAQLGFVSKSDLENLEERLTALEERLDALENPSFREEE